MSELHLHVGFPKCASSYLQLFCLENADRLRELGFIYPEVFTRRNGNATPLAMSLMDRVPEFYARRAKDYTDVLEFDKLMHEQYLKHQDGKSSLLLSSEGFLKFGPEFVQEKFSKYFDKIHIYIVVRPQVSWVESHYTQRTHTGLYKGTITDFIDKELIENPMYRVLLLDRLYEEWVSVFTKHHVHFLYVSRNSPPIEEQFLNALSIEIDESFDRLNRKINPAINPAFLPIILRLPACAYIYHLDLIKGLTKIWNAHSFDLKGSILSPEQRIEIRRRYLKHNKRFSKKTPHIPKDELCDGREGLPYIPLDRLREREESHAFFDKAEALLEEIRERSVANDGKEV